MKTLFCIILILSCGTLTEISSLANNASVIPETGDGAAQHSSRNRTRRRTRQAKQKTADMKKTQTCDKSPETPVLDTPNRLEIDPGDIPPSQRPRNPNVDDRTKIPKIVSPDDMAPPAKPRKPKRRRP